MRGAFNSGHVTPAMASSMAERSARITSSQVGKRARRLLKALPEAALRVRWESSAEISSDSGSFSLKYGIGHLYTAQSRACTTSARSPAPSLSAADTTLGGE